MNAAVKNASDYIFGFDFDDTDPDHGTIIIVQEKAYIAKYGHFYDQHIGFEIEDIWPSDIVQDEIAEGMFEIGEDLTLEEVKAKFIAAGFDYTEEFQQSLDDCK